MLGDENVQILKDLLSTASPNDPDFDLLMEIQLDNLNQWCQCHGRVLSTGTTSDNGFIMRLNLMT